MARCSLADYLPDFLDHGQEIAYVQRRGYRVVRWSYRQVAETAFQFARELEARGISKAERVLVWGPNSAEWVAVFLGCAMRGVVVVPIDDASALDFALLVHQQVGARLWLCSTAHLQPSIPTIILEDLAAGVAGRSPALYPAVPLQPTDTLEIVFTSGTTSEPKGVVISHRNVLANVAPLESEIRKYRKYERWVHPVRFLTLLPLSHVFGQFLGIFVPQVLGGTVIFQGTLKPQAVIDTIRRERVSVLVTVPRVLQALKAKVEHDLSDSGRSEEFQTKFRAARERHFLRRWWIFRRSRRQFGWKFWAVISGGATLDQPTEEFWDRLGYAVIQGYGLTETTSIISVNHPFRRGKGSIGKVLEGREIKLSKDGEILVQGAGVASSYWKGGELQPIVSSDGWYGTGDLGELDAQGNLYFKGRKKDVIVTAAGMNVHPEDLETVLRRQPEVKDAVVIPRARDGNAEPFAVLLLQNGQQSAEAVIRRANASLAEYQRMNSWWVWPEEDFPRTATQKSRRALIQQTTEAQWSLDARDSESPLTSLIERIAGRPLGSLSPDANLDSDLNLSSLDRVELLGALEDRYQIDLTETRFSAASTVGDVERMLRGDSPPRVRHHYPRWALRWPVTWVRLLVHYLLLRPAVLVLGWPVIKGRENLREVHGPVLVICNHVGDVDPGFVLAALPPRLRHKVAIATGGEALENLRTPPASRSLIGRTWDQFKWLLGVSLLNLFPLPREAGFRDSFAYAGECVDHGYSVLVFPEGRHTGDGRLLPFRSGIGLLANNLGIPVVPMRIDGLFEVKQAGRKLARPGEIRIRIGAAIRVPPAASAERFARELQKKVEEL